MKTTLKLFALCCAALVAYLLLWPVPVTPQAWPQPKSVDYSGVFAQNQRLATFEKMTLDGLHGPEAVVADAQGNLYASTHEGWIVRWMEGSNAAERWVKLAGRPLGLAFDANHNLWVADAYIGLIKVTPQGKISTVLTEFADSPIVYIDDLVVAPNGKIYFSDASTKFAPKEWGGTLQASLLDIMEHGKYGRVIEFDPATQKTRLVMDELSFANGVTIDPQGQFLLVVETGEYRVWKHWLTGDKAGQSEVIASDFPGFPDNIHRGREGRYWVGLTAPRSTVLDALAEKPFLRKVVQRFPAFMRPKVLPYGMVIAIDGDGNVVQNLQDPSGKAYATTGAFEAQGFLYVSSLTAPFLAKYSFSVN